MRMNDNFKTAGEIANVSTRYSIIVLVYLKLSRQTIPFSKFGPDQHDP